MFARSTTLVGNPEAMDSAIAFVANEVWPMLQTADGCGGVSMIVNRDTGRAIVTSSWRTAEQMDAAAAMVAPMRERGMEILQAGPPTVTAWEIVGMHRAHHAEPGTCVRAAWSRVSPQHIDGAIDFYRYVLLPDIEAMPGFVSASLMVDRDRGRGVTSVAFESREDMERTREKADYLRGISTQEAHVEFLDVEEFELALAHLDVPEMA